QLGERPLRPGRGGRRQHGTPELLLGERRVGGDRAEVELQVLGVGRERAPQRLETHQALISAAASIVASPFFQLHAHSSSLWSASSTRRTSPTLRPTEPAVTITNWISLFGS